MTERLILKCHAAAKARGFDPHVRIVFGEVHPEAKAGNVYLVSVHLPDDEPQGGRNQAIGKDRFGVSTDLDEALEALRVDIAADYDEKGNPLEVKC